MSFCIKVQKALNSLINFSAGFKSFVDPTVVDFPSQLVAVVGPNGCGKSNIIDAVRWVMGESSAKNLRGESMTDVIFNGSSNRKPVGQASVELVFDNSLGRIIGPFASYGEIAVKRTVNRDGDSFYYLNGSRCRRRDITDIFLGTGAGARSYSIIGQGTISKLIEAKPEELRGFLEEAAGVSKYKERRRETLQRVEHTRENLTRVSDIRDELDKQLQRLQRQAKAAERYTQLKEEEKQCRAQILALKWKEYTEQQSVKQRELHDLALSYEQQQSLVTASNTDRTLLNQQLQEANDEVQHTQAAYYQLATEIARIEEAIQQQERDKKRLEQDRQQIQADWQVAAEQVKQDKEDLLTSQLKEQQLKEQQQEHTLELNQKKLHCEESKKQQAQWETQWNELNQLMNRVKRELDSARINLEHLDQRRQESILRLEKLNAEQALDSLSQLKQAKNDLVEQQIKLRANLQFDEEQFHHSQEQINQVRALLQETEQQLHQVQDEFHSKNTEHASLVAAQKAARKGRSSTKPISQEWVETPKLMDVLNVEPQWQLACEFVLNEALHAYVLEDFDVLNSQWSSEIEHIITTRPILGPTPGQSPSYPRLADKIQGPVPSTVPNLEHIYTAEHLEEAISWLPHCLDHESVVTPNGFWLGKGWGKKLKIEEQDDLGLLTRQQKITDLFLSVKQLKQDVETLKTQRDGLHQQFQQHLKNGDLFKLNLHASTEALNANINALNINQQSIQHTEQLLEGITIEKEELGAILEELTTQQLELSSHQVLLENQIQEYEEQSQQLMEQKQTWLFTLEEQQKQLEERRIQLHQIDVAYDREVTKIQQLMQRINREQERLDVLFERLEHLNLLCLNASNPDAELNEQLLEKLQKHAEVEQQLTLRREQLTQLKMSLDELEKTFFNQDREVKQVQELIAQVRMQEHELSVRASSMSESLDELGLHPSLLLEQLPEETTQNEREEELLSLSEKIKRLGPINCAAIEEYASEQQRKMYLDEQHEDLSQALATLETAIEKMDKETRLRLEETFDEVNTSFKSLFPRLFGGGRAQLELTCDNLLEAGIVVMAQPPGKRNSTIHLLSGGEKAMTAVALVFAIFQLNPSPFCMLDEVDAPLDDVNVGRFCDLVKEMSQFVQFLFITHNKVTMELADHLIGVTMREPGVSRLVAVDVKQALTME